MFRLSLLVLLQCVSSSYASETVRNRGDFQTEAVLSPCMELGDSLVIEPPESILKGVKVILGSDFILHRNFKRKYRSSSLSDVNSNYTNICLKASWHTETFDSFLNEPSIIQIVDTLSEEHGHLYLKRIRDMQLLDSEKRIVTCMRQFKTLDLFGNSPRIFWYGPQVGFMSPLALRYVSVLSELVGMFGSLEGMNIAEIGCGFGGQAKTIGDVFAVASYTFIDLPEVLALTSRFLDYFPRVKSRALFLAPTLTATMDSYEGNEFSTPTLDEDKNILPEYDLCLSNYAFSELSYEDRERYWVKVIRRCKRGYFIYNGNAFLDHPVSGERDFDLMELSSRLQRRSRKVEFFEEVPMTGPSNAVIAWGLLQDTEEPHS